MDGGKIGEKLGEEDMQKGTMLMYRRGKDLKRVLYREQFEGRSLLKGLVKVREQQQGKVGLTIYFGLERKGCI